MIKEQALKATFIVTTWEDILEAAPEDPSAWMVTRRKVRELKREERGVEEKGGEKWKED